MSNIAVDQDHYPVFVEFKHPVTGAPLTVTAGAWTLTDGCGVVVNGRDGVGFADGTSTSIGIQNQDLNKDDGLHRELIITGSINTITHGVMSLRRSFKFTIDEIFKD